MKNLYQFVSAHILSSTGDWFRSILLITTLIRLNSNPAMISFYFVMGILPSIILTPIASPLSKKFKKKQIILFGDMIKVVTSMFLIPIVYWESIIGIIIIVFINGGVNAISAPSKSILIPLMVSKEDLVKANSLMAATQSIVMLLSTALGGVANTFLNAFTILSISIACLFIAIILISFINVNEVLEVSTDKVSHWRNMANSFTVLKTNSALKSAVSFSVCREFIGGFIYVFFSYQILQLLDLGSMGLSYGYIATGIGQILGSYCINKFSNNLKKQQVIYTVILASISAFLFFHSLSYLISHAILFFILNFIASLFYNPISVVVNVLIANSTEEKNHGNAFFINHFYTMLAYLLGFVAVGVLSLVFVHDTVLYMMIFSSIILLVLTQYMARRKVKVFD